MERSTPDRTSPLERNLAKLRELFPDCVTEALDEKGHCRLAVDFDQLRQELADRLVEGPQERYQLNWPGKRQALLAANTPTAKTLRPARDESVQFDTTKNLFIEGDNLDVLKILQETYLGAVKMIYIDPPYNTGNDFVYRDDYAEDARSFLVRSNQKDEHGNALVANTEANGRFHSDWLSMIYARLKLARNLLRDDGVIFISIDDGEVANLRKVADEIFGENNFVAQIAWEKRYTRSNNAKRFYSLKDTILVYRRSEALDTLKEGRTEKANANYRNIDDDPRGPWMTSSYVNPATRDARPNLVYPIRNPFTGTAVTHPTHAWKYSARENQAHVAENRLWWGKDGSADFPRLKLFLREQTEGLVPVDLWDYKSSGTTDEGGQEIKELFGAAVFDTPKPTKLIGRMLGIATRADGGDIVLDFFSGSSATAHAVMQQNAADGGDRRFIMVQVAEPTVEASVARKAGYRTIAEIGKERLRRAGARLLAETGPDGRPGDVGFRVLKLDQSSFADIHRTPDTVRQGDLLGSVDPIRADRTAEDLLFQVLVDLGFDLALPVRRATVLDRTVFSVDRDALVACFDAGLTEELARELAGLGPSMAVFRDSGFPSDAARINIEQIFRQLSPATEIRSI